MNQLYDVIIIGGGPAGLSAAYSAWENGAKKIIVIERDREYAYKKKARRLRTPCFFFNLILFAIRWDLRYCNRR